MADYTIKELANTFGCSKQSIFNYIDELKEQGFTSKRGNQIIVNESGFNYIREKKQSSGRVTSKEPTKREKQEEKIEQPLWFYRLQAETLEQQIEELKKEKEYYKKLVEDKDNYIKHLQDNIVEISLKAMQLGLPQGNEAGTKQEENKQQEDIKETEKQSEKKSFLSRLFTKN